MKHSKKRPIPGDVFRFSLPGGSGHIQFIERGSAFHSIILVGPMIMEEKPPISPKLLENGYFAPFHVPAALRAGFLEFVGALPILSAPKRWRVPNGSFEVNWRIQDQFGGEYLTNELTEEERMLPIEAAPNNEALCMRVFCDWRPERFLHNRSEAWGRDPELYQRALKARAAV